MTHSAIVLGNFFRRKGFMVALAERNDSGAFDAICTDFGEHCFAEGYYTLNGVDFYPGTEEEETDAVQQRPYNVIILDFGAYGPQNKDAFERCEDRIIIAGSKSWELDATNRIFANASADVLEKYIFVFNHTKQEDYDAIRKGMGRLEQVHFLPYAEDPLMSAAFPDGDAIFADILPEEPEQEAAKGFLSKLRKGKERR